MKIILYIYKYTTLPVHNTRIHKFSNYVLVISPDYIFSAKNRFKEVSENP